MKALDVDSSLIKDTSIYSSTIRIQLFYLLEKNWQLLIPLNPTHYLPNWLKLVHIFI